MVAKLNDEVEHLQESVKDDAAQAELKRFLNANVGISKSSSSLPSKPAGVQIYDMDQSPERNEENVNQKGNAGGNTKQTSDFRSDAPTFFPTLRPHPSDAATPANSAFGDQSAVIPSGKQTSERIHLGGWPTIKGFRTWKLAFKEAVAAASNRPDAAYQWITAVEKATSFDELADSGEFPQLDALLPFNGVGQNPNRRIQEKTPT